MSVILGIDPGLARTGYGIVRSVGNQLSFINGGVIATDAKAPLGARLCSLHEGITSLIAEFKPETAAIEETFVNMNNASSLKLAQARGAVMLTLALSGLNAAEYAPNRVKKSVVGVGHADKNQISVMVRMLLPGCQKLPADAMDALAIAITHAHFFR